MSTSSSSVIDLIRRVVDTAKLGRGDPKTLLISLASGKDGVLDTADDTIPPETRQKLQALLDLGLIDELLTVVTAPQTRAKCPIFPCLGGRA